MPSPQVHKERLVSDLQAVVAEAEELLKATANQAGDGVADMRHRIKASLERAKRNLVDIEDAALEKAKAAGRATDAYVHENPWQSIGVAAGVGLLLGLLIARR